MTIDGEWAATYEASSVTLLSVTVSAIHATQKGSK